MPTIHFDAPARPDQTSVRRDGTGLEGGSCRDQFLDGISPTTA